jgi:hypothetical protein
LTRQQGDGAGGERQFSCRLGVCSSGTGASAGLFTAQRLLVYGSAVALAYVVGLVWRRDAAAAPCAVPQLFADRVAQE